MTDTHRFSVSVAAAVIREDGKFLAIQRRDNMHWEPPGGVVEPGERLHDALIREVQEETGFVIEPDRLTGVYQNLERDIVALVFRAQVRRGQPTASNETVRVDWVDREDLANLMDDAYAVRLADALLQTEVPVRTHDGQRLLN